MAVEAIGLDHVYVAVRDLGASEAFYDRVMDALGFTPTTEEKLRELRKRLRYTVRKGGVLW